MAKYLVKDRLKYGEGKPKVAEAGETVELDEETAAPLVERGVVEAAKAEKK